MRASFTVVLLAAISCHEAASVATDAALPPPPAPAPAPAPTRNEAGAEGAARAAPSCPAADAAKVAPFAEDDAIVSVPVPPIDDPKDVLAPFYDKVARLARGLATRPVRIGMFGDSNLTADATTGRLRRQLQARFGDGGHGYVALAHPWDWYSHNDVHHDGTWKLWRPVTTSTNRVADNHYGFANIGSEYAQPGASAWVSTDPREGAPIGWTAKRFDVFYLKRPGGGQFDLLLDGVVEKTIDTRADAFEAGFELVETTDAHHEIKVETKGHGPVRVYGVALERDPPSIVVDSLGTGSFNFDQMAMVDDTTRAPGLQRRAYDLVIIHLGTNIFVPDSITEKSAKSSLDSLRAAIPGLPILMMSPPDSAEDDPHHDDARVVHLAKELHAIATANGVAFFDYFAAMGGKDAIFDFLKKRIAQPDRVHLNKKGDELMADRMLTALFAGLGARLAKDPSAGCDL